MDLSFNCGFSVVVRTLVQDAIFVVNLILRVLEIGLLEVPSYTVACF